MKPSTPTVAIAPAAEESPAEVPLEGVVVPRTTGGFMQVTMDGMAMVVRMYDAEKKPVEIDVDRATVRVQYAAREDVRITLMRSDDGMKLTVGKPVPKPHVFRLNIGLFRGESSESVESYQIAFP